MKAILVLFDSLNKRMMSCYGNQEIHTPNFDRLASHSVIFDKSYVSSLPCMPSRRDLHIGRPNFLHKSWGPLEPYDKSMIDLLRISDVYTHLVSDHFHYWEEGGANYHTKYHTWEIVRGQEGDPWIGQADAHSAQEVSKTKSFARRQDAVNRKYIIDEKDFPISQVFEKGMAFIQNNKNSDNWFLQIESFDPHEPFYSHERYSQLYKDKYDGIEFDWPEYKNVTESDEEITHCRNRYKSLLAACDDYLGRLLDLMDDLDLWKDTMLIVGTDHGFLLAEHGWWGKSRQPLYNEISNTPFFFWDPRTCRRNERSNSLVQLVDVPVTLLSYFNKAVPDEMTGKDIGHLISEEGCIRDGVMFGIHGCHVNVTDGRYVYMRAPAGENKPLYEYTMYPAHMKTAYSIDELSKLTLSEPFSFTQGLKQFKIPSNKKPVNFKRYPTLLFDIKKDPFQNNPIQDEEIERYMKILLVKLMKENDCPDEQFVRLGLTDFITHT